MNQRSEPTIVKLASAVLGVALIGLGPGGCGPQTFVIGVGPGEKKLKATVVQRDVVPSGGRRVAIVDVSGMIVNMNQFGLLEEGEHPVSLLHEQLERARKDNRVRAIILRLNTSGGTVTASDAMYREVMRFKKRSSKPVVAMLMDVAASGGYYVACSADRIITYPTSITGSIGVIFQTVSVQPALNRIGVHTDAIVSGPNKAAGSWLSAMDPEQRIILQKLVDDFYHRFVALVRTTRPNITDDDFESVVDGRVISGNTAVEMGLADATGDLYDAWADAKRLAGVKTADLVHYHRPLRFVGSPYAHRPTGTVEVNLAKINLNGLAAPVGFYYLWQP